MALMAAGAIALMIGAVLAIALRDNRQRAWASLLTQAAAAVLVLAEAVPLLATGGEWRHRVQWSFPVESIAVHLDPLGNLHLCQGICIGNLFRTPLREICRTYDPAEHPVIGPLLAGGPAELARRYDVSPRAAYADACHLCYETRLALRPRFPDALHPDQMYGA